MAVKNHHLNKHKLEVNQPPMEKRVILLVDDDTQKMVKLGKQARNNGGLLDFHGINVEFIFGRVLLYIFHHLGFVKLQKPPA